MRSPWVSTPGMQDARAMRPVGSRYSKHYLRNGIIQNKDNVPCGHNAELRVSFILSPFTIIR